MTVRTVTLTTGDVAETGCWIAGHWGWRGSLRLIEIAEGFDFDQKLTDDDRRAMQAVDDGDDTFVTSDGTISDPFEWVSGQGGLADDAEAWLNKIAPEGWSFGWHDGEFFLWSDEDWEQEAW